MRDEISRTGRPNTDAALIMIVVFGAALVVLEDSIFAADSTSARVLVGDDGGLTWTSTTGGTQLLDLAVDPVDPDRMIGVDFDRGLVATEDGGQTWQPIPGSPELVEIEWTNESLERSNASGICPAQHEPGTVLAGNPPPWLAQPRSAPIAAPCTPIWSRRNCSSRPIAGSAGTR